MRHASQVTPVVQVGWAVSAMLQTDKLYDLLGSTTFVALAIGTLAFAARFHARSAVATVLVCCWALRLGGFLFFRVLNAGSDSRFDEAKKKPGVTMVSLESPAIRHV